MVAFRNWQFIAKTRILSLFLSAFNQGDLFKNQYNKIANSTARYSEEGSLLLYFIFSNLKIFLLYFCLIKAQCFIFVFLKKFAKKQKDRFFLTRQPQECDFQAFFRGQNAVSKNCSFTTFVKMMLKFKQLKRLNDLKTEWPVKNEQVVLNWFFMFFAELCKGFLK